METNTKPATIERTLRTATTKLRQAVDTLGDMAIDQKQEGGVMLTADQVKEFRMLMLKASEATGRAASALNYAASSFTHATTDHAVESGLTEW